MLCSLGYSQYLNGEYSNAITSFDKVIMLQKSTVGDSILIIDQPVAQIRTNIYEQNGRLRVSVVLGQVRV